MLPRAHRGWFLLLSAPIILIAGAGLWLLSRTRSSSASVSIASLFPASMRSRPIEARVSGLPWAPFAGVARASGAPANKRGEEAPPTQTAANGALELLAGDPRVAIAALEKASAANQPAVWSDLAAAYHEVAVRHDVPELLADALAAADRALALDPDRVEALFNRALILERLGLHADARAAWTRYLAAEPAGGWSDEARGRLKALAPQQPFLEVLDAGYDRVGSDPAAAEAIYAHDPFAARGPGVVEVLGRWGEAVLRGDERDALRHLNVARRLGDAVARGGDLTLQRSVAVIDAASDRSRLARAHADFRAGMKAYGGSRLDEAEPLLRRAAAVLQQAGSPTAFPAALWAADCVYERGRREEARKEIEELLATTPAEFPAYRAFMLWQLANCRNARGEWGTAISLFEESAALFEKLGENGNVANVRRLLAAVYDRIGDPETAWKNRLASMSGQGIRAKEVDELTVWSIVEAAIVRRDWYMASSFLNVYLGVVRRLGNDVELTTGLLMRAVVRDRLDDARGVQDDIAEARRTAVGVTDASYREMLRVAEWRTIGMLRSTPPATAGALLTRAIDYESTLGHASTLPGLLLLRARVRRRAENLAGAMDDVRRGIEQMEQHRESLPAGAARWGAFQAAEELFDEGVDLAMIEGDPEAAFRFTEKARARSLLDSYGASPAADLRALPAQTAVVEIATLPDSLVIFVADAAGVRAVRTNVSRATLAAGADAFDSALKDDERPKARRLGASMYRRLVEPVASTLAGVPNVVFVPDDVTATIPFGALVDSRGDYLLQHHAIVVAPSASAFIVANERRGRNGAPRSALVVTAAGSTLRSVEGEAKRILRNYRRSWRIEEDASQFEELAERAQAVDVLHFGGHAVGDARGYEPASLVLRERGEEHRVGVAEIAKLRLDRASVVVLAGCSTASGQRRASEGVISVAHGFLSAGVPSAIATLWPISDDDAARFFPRLHEKLAAGMSPAEALRETQLESIRQKDVPPSLWAAVQDFGS